MGGVVTLSFNCIAGHGGAGRSTAKLICLAGYSGAGKTAAARTIRDCFPNAWYPKVSDELFMIRDRDELERLYGVPVPVGLDEGRAYLKIVSALFPNKERKLIELLLPYIRRHFETEIAKIMCCCSPEFIVLEWIAMPLLESYWQRAFCRIIVEPADWEMLYRYVEFRPGQDTVSRELAEERRAAACGILEGAVNVDYRISNAYDDNFRRDIMAIRNDLVSARDRAADDSLLVLPL